MLKRTPVSLYISSCLRYQRTPIFILRNGGRLIILITVADTCSRTLTAINTAALTNNLGDDAFTGGRLFDGLSDARPMPL